MAWSDAARQAALEARRRHELMIARKSALAKATYKPSTAAKHATATASEAAVKRALKTKANIGVGNTHPVDVVLRRGRRTMGVEVKTLIDNKNNKITMHPESVARKRAWAAQNHASLHTVVIDSRPGQQAMYYRKGIGSFRLTSLHQVASGAALRRLLKL